MSKYLEVRIPSGKKEEKLFRERARQLLGDRKSTPKVFPKQQLGRVDSTLRKVLGL